MQGTSFQYKYQRPLQHPPTLSPSTAKSSRVSGSAPTVERRSAGVDEETKSEEPQSSPAGRMEMELPPPSGAGRELSRLGAYQALGWMLRGRW